jgi:hypothetical protein
MSVAWADTVARASTSSARSDSTSSLFWVSHADMTVGVYCTSGHDGGFGATVPQESGTHDTFEGLKLTYLASCAFGNAKDEGCEYHVQTWRCRYRRVGETRKTIPHASLLLAVCVRFVPDQERECVCASEKQRSQPRQCLKTVGLVKGCVCRSNFHNHVSV